MPHPNNDQFKSHQFWKLALPDLRTAYGEVCSYCSCWVPFGGSVDHFEPKSIRPAQAYEWTNFRFAQEKLNQAKNNSTDVLDPFTVQLGWFALDFASFYVRANAGLPKNVEDAVNTTIATLKLNSAALVRLRYSVLKGYSDGMTTIAYLERYYPFIASELRRQGLQDTIIGTVR